MFVPEDFAVPHRLETPLFVLEPLGPQHNDEDYAAWSTSVEQIRGTPGWEGGSWPRPMSLEDNRRDLERHARDFESREGFTYTVLDRANGEVVGCVYIYPSREAGADAVVQSWVRATSASLDAELWRAVSDWLADSWPFERISYAPRSTPGE
ncbi:MAG: GNAT family N-acetyltransferase [Gaiellaceae bacterium]